MTIIAVPKVLRDKLTEAGTDAFVQIMDKVEERAQAATLELAEERFEKRLAQLDAKIETSAAKMDAKIEQSRANLIQWMFVFWVGQVGTITAILFAFFKP